MSEFVGCLYKCYTCLFKWRILFFIRQHILVDVVDCILFSSLLQVLSKQSPYCCICGGEIQQQWLFRYRWEELADWFTCHGELGYESVDVLYPPQKSSELLFSSQRFHLYNCLDFVWIDFNSSLAYHKPQQLSGCYTKSALLWIQPQLVEPDPFKELP